MRSIRLSIAIVVVLILIPGCGPDEMVWPAGTEAILADSHASKVIARVPGDQRPKAKRRSLWLPNQSPVIIVDDPAYRTTSKKPPQTSSLIEPVRVRLSNGDNEGTEIIVRRNDLAPIPAPDQKLAELLPVFFLILLAGAFAFWLLETFGLLLKEVWRNRRDQLALYSHLSLAARQFAHKPRSRNADRTDLECDRWNAWVTAMNVRRKSRQTANHPTSP
jgi:hypothetical protein